jgi:hypothetical protein
MVTALWSFLGEGWQRWIFCTVILAAAFVLMGRLELHRWHIGPRSYRYAE